MFLMIISNCQALLEPTKIRIIVKVVSGDYCKLNFEQSNKDSSLIISLNEEPVYFLRCLRIRPNIPYQER